MALPFCVVKRKESSRFADLHFILSNQVMISGQKHCCCFWRFEHHRHLYSIISPKSQQITLEQSTWVKGKICIDNSKANCPIRNKASSTFLWLKSTSVRGKIQIEAITELRTHLQEKPVKKIYFAVSQTVFAL